MAHGDMDISALAALVADRSRAQILLALADGRALPASRLASEAAVTPATTSSHLAKLTAAGLLEVEAHGRHRYYRLAGPAVAQLLERLQQLAPAEPIRSLRQGTRAYALREARTCYDHLAGRVAVELMRAFIERGYLAGGDGSFDPAAGLDPRAGYGRDIDYSLTEHGDAFLAELGVADAVRRRDVRYCVDWSEQRHHLSGALGRALLERFLQLGWVCPTEETRAVRITDAGAAHLREIAGGGAGSSNRPRTVSA